MAQATGVLQSSNVTAYILKDGATGYINETNLDTAANRDWDDIAGSDKLIEDDNRIEKITLTSAINETASTTTESVEVYGPDDRITVSSTTDVSVDPIEFTAVVDFSATTKAANKVLPNGTDAAAVGTTKYFVGIVWKTSDTQQTALVTVATLTRRQVEPPATGVSQMILGFTPVNNKVYLVGQS